MRKVYLVALINFHNITRNFIGAIAKMLEIESLASRRSRYLQTSQGDGMRNSDRICRNNLNFSRFNFIWEKYANNDGATLAVEIAYGC